MVGDICELPSASVVINSPGPPIARHERSIDECVPPIAFGVANSASMSRV